MEFTIIIYYNHTVPIISVAFATYCLYKKEYKFMKKAVALLITSDIYSKKFTQFSLLKHTRELLQS